MDGKEDGEEICEWVGHESMVVVVRKGGGTTELSLARDTAAAPMGKYLLPTG